MLQPYTSQSSERAEKFCAYFCPNFVCLLFKNNKSSPLILGLIVSSYYHHVFSEPSQNISSAHIQDPWQPRTKRGQSKQKSKHWVFSSYQSLVLHHLQLKQATSKGPHQNHWVWFFKFHVRIEQGRLPYHRHQAKNSWLNTFTHLIVHHSSNQWSQAFPCLKERCCCRLFCGIEFNELENVCCEFVLMAEGSHWSITFVIRHRLLICPLHLWKWASVWEQVECVELTRGRENKSGGTRTLERTSLRACFIIHTFSCLRGVNDWRFFFKYKKEQV